MWINDLYKSALKQIAEEKLVHGTILLNVRTTIGISQREWEMNPTEEQRKSLIETRVRTVMERHLNEISRPNPSGHNDNRGASDK